MDLYVVVDDVDNAAGAGHAGALPLDVDTDLKKRIIQ